MRKALLIFGIGSFLIGVAILLYDAYFFHRYGVDVNEVAAVVDGGIADWPTGERPAFTYLLAFYYGVAFTSIGVVLFVVQSWMSHRRKSSS